MPLQAAETAENLTTIGLKIGALTDSILVSYVLSIGEGL